MNKLPTFLKEFWNNVKRGIIAFFETPDYITLRNNYFPVDNTPPIIVANRLLNEVTRFVFPKVRTKRVKVVPKKRRRIRV